MRSISTDNQTALNARQLVARDFLWIVARNRETGEEEPVGFWSDIENVTGVQVIEPETGDTVSRTYYGAGGLISISAIPAVSVLQVNDIDIEMSQLDEMVEEAIRLYDIKQAKVEVHRGLFDPDSRKLVAPALLRFAGFVNLVRIKTPAEGDNGGVMLQCVSHTQELMRANPATRAHEDQQLRSSDDFFKDTAVVSEWDYEWGEIPQKQKTNTKPPGLFGWNNFLGFL